MWLIYFAKHLKFVYYISIRGISVIRYKRSIIWCLWIFKKMFFNSGISQLCLAQESVAPSNPMDLAILPIPLLELTLIGSIDEMHTFYWAVDGCMEEHFA